MILGDSCEPLIALYQAIIKDPYAVWHALRLLISQGTDEATFRRVRAKTFTTPAQIAARIIYLNKLCFNGLYRENRRGIFNVPYGRNSDGSAHDNFPTPEHIVAVHMALATSTIGVRDFSDTISKARPGDVLYCDSPYYGTFSGYASKGFNDDEHTRLADSLHSAATHGVAVIASNIDHARVRELYDWATIVPVDERHVIGATGARRGLKSAVLILSEPNVLG